MKKRIQYIDIAKGIAILCVIAGHSFTMNGLCWKIINSFHMPLFILTSGFFFKERPFKEEFKAIFTKLLFPTFIISYIYSFIRSMRAGIKIAPALINAVKSIVVCYSKSSKIPYNLHNVSFVWFVYMLAVVRLLFLLNKKISGNNKILLIALVTAESYLGYLVGIKGYWLPWSLDVAFACVVFYYIGHLLKKYQITDYLHTNKLTFLVILPIWAVGAYFNTIGPALRIYPNGLWSFVTAVCGSLCVVEISRLTEDYLKVIPKFLAWCGKNSLYILYCHLFEGNLVTYPFKIQSKRVLKAVTILTQMTICTVVAFVYTFIKSKIILLFDTLKNKKTTT